MSDLQSLLERLKGANLTQAEFEFLQLAVQGEVDVSWRHPVAEALGARGLVTCRHCVPASAFLGGQVAKITPAGRSLLQALIASKSPSEPTNAP